MTKTKKTIIFLGLPILAFLVSIPLWPERYGDSYSEQQRKLWNEQMALSKDEEFLSGYPDYDFGDKNDHLQHLIEHKTESAKAFQKSAGEEWNISIDTSPNLANLPLEGMTFDELVHDGEINKNPDAFLLLISSSLHRHFYSSVSQELHFCETWLRKAADLNRPGADFLIRIVEEKKRTKEFDDQFDHRSATDFILKLPGYAEFQQLIDSGDFALYKALVSIQPAVHLSPIGNNLRKLLKQKALDGDLIAQRQWGQFGFLAVHDNTVNQIEQERDRPRNRFILWLAAHLKKWVTIRTTANSSPTRDQLDEHARWLRKAADAGDLVAMELWLRFGFETVKQSDRETWQAVFSYYNRLLKSGYKPMSMTAGVYIEHKWAQLILRYYSPQSLNRVQSDCLKALVERGAEIQLIPLALKTQQEYPSVYLDRILRQTPGLLFADGGYLLFLKDTTEPETRRQLIDVIRTQARQDDPEAMFALADILQRGMNGEPDHETAIRLLEQAWALCPRYDEVHEYPDPTAPPYDDHCAPLSHLIVEKLMMGYLVHSPSLENQRKAFLLAQEFDRYVKKNYSYSEESSSYLYFYLSLIHQKGYGTQPDGKKSASFYHKIKPSLYATKERIEWLIEQFDYKTPQ